jgi:hypothetical protein
MTRVKKLNKKKTRRSDRRHETSIAKKQEAGEESRKETENIERRQSRESD